MEIILNPEVEIIASTHFHGSNKFHIPADGGHCIKTSAFAAKVCYDSNGESGRSNTENQRSILEHRHGSVLEHAVVSLYVTGITRAVSLEINRHRTFAISQRSTRYVKEGNSAIVLDPYYASLYTKYHFQFFDASLGLASDSPTDIQSIREMKLIRDYVSSCMSSINAYQKEVERLEELNPNKLSGFDLRKWARGKARNLLPHAIETRAVYTTNIRAWRWFIESRSNRHAEPEIRRLANVIYKRLYNFDHVHFEDFHVSAEIDGIPELVPQYSKV